jgi:hypothetical protein
VKYVKIPTKAFQILKINGSKIVPYYIPGSPDWEGRVLKGRPTEEVMF